MIEIDGSCHCGSVRYRAQVDPEKVSICHCTDCQALTGTAFRVSVRTPRQDLKITGEPKVYEKRGDNGRKRFQYFCPNCGSPLFTNGEGEDAPARRRIQIANARHVRRRVVRQDGHRPAPERARIPAQVRIPEPVRIDN